MLVTTLEKYLDDEISELSADVQVELLRQIGSTDQYVRDKLIYGSFCKLIFSNQFTKDERKDLLVKVMQDDYLFYTIGEKETDAVFTRSFSALVIAAIVEYDVVALEFDGRLIEQATSRIVEYMMVEKDVRGFVEGKGWAHAIAHGADALNALAKHPNLPKESVGKVLRAIEHALFNQVNYLDEEEERLAVIISSLAIQEDGEKEVQSWFEKIKRTIEKLLIEEQGSIDAYHTQRTVKNFMKSVYIILKSKEQNKELSKDVFQILREWMYLQ